MSNSMINPPIIDLLDKVGDRYSLVVIAAKRARDIIDGDESLVDIPSTKPVTLAVNEINEGKLVFESLKSGIK
ncbi:DNA-directed RNA polymerase subunit omega [Clostridium cylindrosporum]|uniref:DNA-directed RNA polymerase subunit omega n=1 Tax=Clostridium cylindrosporum DSM 605 TaxID=1121307 RepID=A0A0J8D6G5_CLOCY|nr:DNA-directed RNA polymerase subunit omega [Clostridium cylindrosporum]KMT21447.1 DNA-directed RNA polymerase subunit omega [Clostridium cylindrosporum DSM 605]